MDVKKLKEQYSVNIVQGNTENMEIQADNLMELFIDSIINHTIKALDTELIIDDVKFEALINYLGINEDLEKQKVYYFAVLRTIIDLTHEIAKKQIMSDSNDYSSYKYVYQILELLQHNMTMTHSNIALRLGISSQNLSNVFRRANKFNLWKIQEYGKSKSYTITAKGKDAYKEYLKRSLQYDNLPIEGTLIQLVKSLSSELDSPKPRAENVIMYINEKFGNTSAVFTSPVLKRSIDTLFVKANNLNRMIYKKNEEYKNNQSMKIKFSEYNFDIKENYRNSLISKRETTNVTDLNSLKGMEAIEETMEREFLNSIPEFR